MFIKLNVLRKNDLKITDEMLVSPLFIIGICRQKEENFTSVLIPGGFYKTKESPEEILNLINQWEAN